MQMNEISILSLFDTNKQQRQLFAQNVIERLNEGHQSALEIHYNIKCFIDIAENITENKEFKNALFEEASRYEKNAVYKNSVITMAEAGVKYDYSQCNDPVYFELLAAKQKAETALKEREKFLKNTPINGQTIIHEGEVLTIFPPSKSGTTCLKTTLK